MFEFHDAGVSVRPDLPEAFRAQWKSLARAGPTLTSAERISVATEARRAIGNSGTPPISLDAAVVRFASMLMTDPGAVDEGMTRIGDGCGEPCREHVDEGRQETEEQEQRIPQFEIKHRKHRHRQPLRQGRRPRRKVRSSAHFLGFLRENAAPLRWTA